MKGLVPMHEGKDKITIELFKALAGHFWNEGDSVNNFCTTWAWNLMCRAMNVAKLTMEAISWEQDCLAIEYGCTKTDKKGNLTCLKHVYCNPYLPEVNCTCKNDFSPAFSPRI